MSAGRSAWEESRSAAPAGPPPAGPVAHPPGDPGSGQKRTHRRRRALKNGGTFSSAPVITACAPTRSSALALSLNRALVHLGAIVAGDAPGRDAADQIPLHCLTGLAGSQTTTVLIDTALGVAP